MELTILTVLLVCYVVFVSSQASESFKEEVVKRHNEIRENHQVEPVKENSDISAFAQEWANHLASINDLKHRSRDVLKQYGYGENVAQMMYESDTGSKVVNDFYEEAKGYEYNTEPLSNAAGHFTALVWKGTTEIGIGKAGRYVVINYSPAGNVEGQYRENVFPPKVSIKAAETRKYLFPLKAYKL